MRLPSALCALILLVTLAPLALASPPLVIHHQGRLLDDADQPISGMVTITMRIFDAPAGGAMLYEETHANVPVSDGLYNLMLGSSTPLSVDVISPPDSPSPVERYIEVVTDGQVLSPRLRLSATPSALSSHRVSGDVQTKPGEIKLSGMSGSTTATIRSSQNPGSSGSEVVLMDGGGSTTGTIRAGVDSSGLSFGSATGAHYGAWTTASTAIATVSNAPGTKGIATGVSPGSAHITVMDGGHVAASIESGDDTTKFLLSKTTPQIKHEYVVQFSESNLDLRMTSDSDGDGLEDQSLSSEISSVVGTTLGLSSDTDGDGVPNSFVEHKSKGSSGGIRLGGMSGSTTGTIRTMASPDSTEQVLDMDDDGDGFSEMQARLKLGVANGGLEISGDRFSSGPRQSVSMDGSFSHAQHRCISDFDRDGNPDVVVASRTDSSGGRNVLEQDSDDDGVEDMSIESSVTDDSATFRLNGLPPGTPYIGNFTVSTSGSSTKGVLSGMSGSTTGTIRMMAEPDSTVEEHSSIDAGGHGGHMRGMNSNIRSHATLGVDRASSSSLSEVTCDSTSARNTLKGMSGSTTGTIRMAADGSGGGGGGSLGAPADLTLEADLDGDAIMDVVISSQTDASSARSTWKGGMSGSTTGTIRMAAGPDSVIDVMDMDSDGDGVAESSIERKTHPNGGVWTMSGSTTGTIRMAVSNSGQSAALTVGTATASHFIDVEGGAYCDGTNWVNASDVASKENFKRVDGAKLLDQIADLEISRWNYKGQEGVEHIGPTAQDFQKAFGVGADNKSISTIDPSGIALAAIKELQKQNADLRAQLEELNRKVEMLTATR